MYEDEEVHSGSPIFKGFNMRGLKILYTPKLCTDTRTSSDGCRLAVPSGVHGYNTSMDENLNSLFFKNRYNMFVRIVCCRLVTLIFFLNVIVLCSEYINMKANNMYVCL